MVFRISYSINGGWFENPLLYLYTVLPPVQINIPDSQINFHSHLRNSECILIIALAWQARITFPFDEPIDHW